MKNLENCHHIYHLNMITNKLKVDYSNNLPKSVASVVEESQEEKRRRLFANK